MHFVAILSIIGLDYRDIRAKEKERCLLSQQTQIYDDI